MRAYGLSRSSVYRLMNTGQLGWTDIKGIRGRRIPRSALTALLTRRGGWTSEEGRGTS
jgi:hypothetical protein